LPPSTEEIVIVSLLGSKPGGLSEFSYYGFRSRFEKPEDRPGCLTFQEWLDRNGQPGIYRVCEYPTIDTRPLSEETSQQAVETVLSSMAAGKTVIVVDSGGFSRTGAVVRLLGSRLNVKLCGQRLTSDCP
jgi:hypothetical protein